MSLLSVKLTNIVIIGCLSTCLFVPTLVLAGPGKWAQNHPRRAEVNGRLANQNRRIHQERREGEINGRQAAQLHRQDHQIRREERQMARQNGGHITRGEQQLLNRQENQVSREIGR